MLKGVIFSSQDTVDIYPNVCITNSAGLLENEAFCLGYNLFKYT